MNESKTRRDWEEEADTFISEWRKATDAILHSMTC